MPKANPHVYLELSIGGHVIGRITFKLFADTVPRTAENFRALCTGEQGRGQQTGKLLHLKNTLIYRIIRDFVAQGGDLSKTNGLVGESVYGGTFMDENFERKHDKRGLLSMANSGPHSNGSHFFITLSPLPNFDGKHVVFGEVVNGVHLLNQLEAVSAGNGSTSREVLISDCGELLEIEGEIESGRQRKRSRETPSPTRRKKKRRQRRHDHEQSSSDGSSYSSSDESFYSSSDADHGRKRKPRKNKHKRKRSREGRKSSKHKDSKSGGSRSRHRRKRTSSSDDSGDMAG